MQNLPLRLGTVDLSLLETAVLDLESNRTF